MQRRAVLALAIFLAACPSASALNQSFDINQYAHTAWTIRDRSFKGIIFSIAQTPEGTIWAVAYKNNVGKFCAMHESQVQCQQEDSALAETIYEDRHGDLWLGGLARPWRRKPVLQNSIGGRTRRSVSTASLKTKMVDS
jgi:hypothetical protein